MTKAALVNFHMYTPFGKEFYQPIFDFFVKNYREIWGKEVDKLYVLDSNWNVDRADDYKIIKTDPNMRYYDCYKTVLPQVKEDLVLFLDDDMVVYRQGKIAETFARLYTKKHPADVVSIYDTIGTWQTDKMNGKNKFCPYWFATRKELLMKYLDVEWGPNMPEHETLGKLTEVMINDGVKSYEWEEDKTSIYFDGTQDVEKGKDLGYYHCRNGSLAAYLLSTKKYGNIDTYKDYLKNQPATETLRLCCWYKYMGGEPIEIVIDSRAIIANDEKTMTVFWENYYEKFLQYHNLP